MIFFDGLDFEERRVDLPCDDEGQVFLAPHRRPKALGDDDNADLLSDKEGVLAEQISVDDSPIAKSDPSHREFGFKRDGEQEKAIEPRLNPAATLAVRRNAITGNFVSLKASPSLASQDPEPGDQDAASLDEGGESDQVGEQLTLPPIEATNSSKARTTKNNDANQITASAEVTVPGTVQGTVSPLQTVSQGIRTSVAALWIFLAAASQVLHRLTMKAANFAILFGGYVRIAGNAACSLGVRLGSALALNFRAASISSLGMSAWLGRRAGASLSTLASTCTAKVGALLKALRLWLPTAGRAYLNDTKKVILIASTAFNMLTMKVVRSSIYLGQRLADALSHLSRARGPSTSAMGYFALNRSMTMIRRTSRFLSDTGGRVFGSMQQNLGRGASQEAQGISSIIKSVPKSSLASSGSVSKKSLHLPLRGLAGAAAVAVLFLTAWSNMSKSTAPSIVLEFPPKPVAFQSGPSQDPIIFDWPPAEIQQNDSERIRVADASPADASIGEGGPLLSPEAALAKLIEEVAPALNSPVGSSSAEAQTSIPGFGNRSSNSKSDRSIQLLADLENIANARAFAKALRTVGLETLIQPDQSYTMLVPSDAAFAKLGQDELEKLLHPSGHDRLRALLSHHILNERLQFDDFAGAIGSHLSLANQTITIVATDVIRVGNASMIETDLRAADTVVHVIDDVLALSGPANEPLSPSATALEAASDT